MQINGTNISCGIATLEGFYGNVTVNQIKSQLDSAAEDSFGMVLASINEEQKAIELKLIGAGFKRIGKWKINPNSGNKIALFVAKIRGKKNTYEW